MGAPPSSKMISTWVGTPPPLEKNNTENFPHTADDGDQETRANNTVREECVSAAKGSNTMDEPNNDGGNINDGTPMATDDDNQDHRYG